MISVPPRDIEGTAGVRSYARLFAGILQRPYRDLLNENVPEPIAALVRQLEDRDSSRR